MVKEALDFVKIHAGWDEIIFVYGEQIPKGQEVDVSLSLLRKPSIGGIEVGILSLPEGSGDIRVRIIDDTKKDFIGMCGGLTQCLGKAIVETVIGENFGIKISEGTNRVVLETDEGPIPIEIDVKNGEFQRVVTDMKSYADDCYKRGVEVVEVEEMRMVNVGINEEEKEYVVLEHNELMKRFPDINFWSKEKRTLDVLKHIFIAFLDYYGMKPDFIYGIIYKREKSNKGKTVRTVFRFFPWDYVPGDKLEFACGTGAIAIGIAMHELGQIVFSGKPEEVLLIVGGEKLPEWMHVKTELKLEGTGQRITGAWFSHDRIELVAAGQVYPMRL